MLQKFTFHRKQINYIRLLEAWFRAPHTDSVDAERNFTAEPHWEPDLAPNPAAVCDYASGIAPPVAWPGILLEKQDAQPTTRAQRVAVECVYRHHATTTQPPHAAIAAEKKGGKGGKSLRQLWSISSLRKDCAHDTNRHTPQGIRTRNKFSDLVEAKGKVALLEFVLL